MLALRTIAYRVDFLSGAVRARLTQTIILLGVILLTANTASTYYNWVIFYAFSQFIFGFGIGGEYPVRFCVRNSIGCLELCGRRKNSLKASLLAEATSP